MKQSNENTKEHKFNEFMGVEYPREIGEFTQEDRELSKQLIQSFIKSQRTETRSDLILLSIKKVPRGKATGVKMEYYIGNKQTHVYLNANRVRDDLELSYNAW